MTIDTRRGLRESALQGETAMSKTVSVFLRLGLITGLLVAIGCASLGKTLEAPRVSFADVRFEEMKGMENVVHIQFRVFNTNDIPLRVKGLDCELAMNGKRLATGVSKVDQEIPAYDTALIPLTLYSSVVDLFRGLISLQGKEKVTFSLAGELRVEGGLWMPSAIPFSAENELTLEGLMRDVK
jgi:LEA14-like dessication related protein